MSKSKIRRPTNHLLKSANDGEVGNHANLVELLVDHEAKDAHHSGTAVVELDGTLGKLGLLIEGIPAEVEGTVAEITGELGIASDVLHDTKLKEANEEEDLDKTSLGDGVGAEDGGKTVGEGIEGVSGLVDRTVQVDSVAGDDLAEEGELADTAVLDLDVTEAVEALLVGILKKAEGIEEAKGGLGTELGLEGLESGGGGALLGGGEGGGAGNEGGDGKGLEHGW
eukprot:CAMPEP_0197733688 /NCGR_PEP_ID=MMETSP1434-20131217/44034_1 /TAXON_ID=265543 /ORGANISM="Minutocellus polymorphus, Strain CCMP3303" /LENGTH=224 /DNA_ID=CAMNT_0043321075 /DNA_START=819 /DNA_END=1490 /DNA_ORIENTATION=+